MNRHFSLVLMLACVAAFALGVGELFKLRFEAGDVYPPYSSLRSDPLGTSALYESLARVPGISVSRDFRMSDEMPDGGNIAYLQLAARSYDWASMPEASFKGIESFVKQGGRLVVAFFPETSEEIPPPVFTPPGKPRPKTSQHKPMPKDGDTKTDKSDKTEKPGKPKRRTTEDEDARFREVSLKDKWGIEFGFKAMKRGGGGAYEVLTVENDDEPSLPAYISWHSGTVFTNLDKSWHVIYARDEDAVLVERKIGSGSVVFSGDSFFLSNEALERERHAELLAWVAGPCRQIMFDEAHFGIVTNPGIAMLVRKYRLHGLVAGLLLLSALFIWKNSVSFVPPLAADEAEIHVAGKDSAAGFVNLLRRHIRPGDVLATCLTEWKKSFGRGRISVARLERVQAVIDADNVLPPKERHPVRTYQAICQALKEPGTTSNKTYGST